MYFDIINRKEDEIMNSNIIPYQKALIVAVDTKDDEAKFNLEIEELKDLAYACEIEVVDVVTQKRRFVDTNTYVGKGKLDEIKLAIDALDIEVVLFNDELLPSQISKLQEALDIQIFDRTYVILEIFRRRAKTKEAYLQVEIASLDYMLPRLTGLHQGLSRQRGTGGGFAHGRGAGETKLELDKRVTTNRIVALREELADLTRLRQEQRTLRKKNEEKVVSLVGYTNSGKSSTLNAILNYSTGIKKEVLEKDMLFATLETSTRRIDLKNNAHFLLTDTVGFVNKLPHHLVESFKSTLEEVKESDLIIHVVDASNPDFASQIEATNKVLTELEVNTIPVIYAFNKIDKVEGYFFAPVEYYPSITISAKSGTNIDELIKLVTNKLFSDYTYQKLLIPYKDTKDLEIIKQNSFDYEIEYSDEGSIFKGKTNNRINKLIEKYKKA